jgi:hypothetical protein
MHERSRTVALFVAGVTVGAALGVFLAPTLSNSKTANLAQAPSMRAFALTSDTSAPLLHYVPTEPLGPTSPWAPLTGDGSN